jgi:hypothetical protein
MSRPNCLQLCISASTLFVYTVLLQTTTGSAKTVMLSLSFRAGARSLARKLSNVFHIFLHHCQGPYACNVLPLLLPPLLPGMYPIILHIRHLLVQGSTVWLSRSTWIRGYCNLPCERTTIRHLMYVFEYQCSSLECWRSLLIRFSQMSGADEHQKSSLWVGTGQGWCHYLRVVYRKPEQ